MIPSHANQKDHLAWLAFVLLSLVGGFIIAYSTRWGAIVYSDSTEYILSARNLLAGNGLGIPKPGESFQPLTHFPPLYPLVLAGLGLFGLDPLESARWLNILLFCMFIVLVCVWIYHFTQKFIPSFLFGVVILTSPLFLELFSMALSESLFFILGFSSLFFLTKYLDSRRHALLVGAGIVAGLACLTRYIGFTLLICGAMVVLAVSRADLKKSLVNLGMFLGPAGGLSAAWLMPIFFKTHQLAARSFQVGDDLPVALREARVSLIDLGWSWLPFSELINPRPSYFIRGWSIIAVLVFLGTLVLVLTLRRLHKSRGMYHEPSLLRLTGVFILFSVIYLATIALSFFFLYPRNDLNGRLLSPVYLSLLIGGFSALFWASKDDKVEGWLVWIPVLGLLLLVVGGYGKSVEFVRANHQNGAGYTSASWLNSPTIRAIKELDPGVALISNQSAAILFLTGRPAYEVKELYCTSPLETYPKYGEDVEDPAQWLFKNGQAILIVFPTSFYWQLFPIYGDQTQARLDGMLQDLYIEQELSDGVMYRYSKP